MLDDRSIIAVIQARMGSTRLPGKVLLPLADRPALWHVIQRLKSLSYLDQIIVATSKEEEDDSIVHFVRWLEDPRVSCFRGPHEDVLARFYLAIKDQAPDYFVRVTGDSPLVCPEHLDRMIRCMISEELDGLDGHREKTGLTLGFGSEVYSFDALRVAHRAAMHPREREHVSLFIKERSSEFAVGYLPPDPILRSPFRLTLDYPEDYSLLSHIYDELYHEGELLSCHRVINYLEAHPEFAMMNAGCIQTAV